MCAYVFNLALRWGTPGLSANPTAGVALFEDPPTKERFLTPEEALRLHAAVAESPNPMLRFIVPMLILTGARRREVLNARWEDFDLDRRQWRIAVTKTGKPRHVPLSGGALQVLATVPRQAVDCPWVFPNPKTGKPFTAIFRRKLGWVSRGGHGAARIHDLRHSFAVRRLLRWHEQGENVHEHMLALSTYMGHAEIFYTYWYLTGVPELMAITARRFEQFADLAGDDDA